MLKRFAGWFGLCLFTMSCTVLQPPDVSALPAQSTNYKFNESSVGGGDLIQSSSANYKSSNATGDLSVGAAASTNFQIQAGTKTTNDPSLAFAITSGGINFSNFSASTATVTTASFSVLNYSSYGYIVQLVGNAPSSSGHTLPALTTTGPSIAGTEQFGINLVANTVPTSVGSNPNNGQFGFGAAATSYSTPNQYRYVSGETIASAPKSSGVTTYTISYLVNVAGLTPGGKYTSNQTLIVTGTY